MRRRDLGMFSALVVLLVALSTVLLVTRARAGTLGGAACDAALPGSAVLAAVDVEGVGLVCEPRPPDAPQWALGYWDSGAHTIRLWFPDDLDPRLARKIAAHELGHAEAEMHPDQLTGWAALRCGGCATADGGTAYLEGSSRIHEDHAEAFSLANFPEGGVGYNFPYGWPSADQLTALRSWWTGRPVDSTTSTAPAPPVPPVAEQAPVAVPPPRPAPPPTSHPSSGLIPAVAIVPPPATAARVAAVLAALREVSH